MTHLSEPAGDTPAWAAVTHIDEVTHRDGGHGPGYLWRGGNLDAGVLRLGPGDATENHFHHRLDEVFLVLEGSATMWIDGVTRVPLVPGESYLSRAGEMHYFLNEADEDFRAFFVKSPFDPADTNPVPWRPGEHLPARWRTLPALGGARRLGSPWEPTQLSHPPEAGSEGRGR